MIYNGYAPTILRIKGYRFFFFSNDSQEPVHIHVDSGDNYAKLWLEPVQLVKSVGYSAKEINDIKKLVFENIELIKEKWYEYFNKN